MAAKNKPVPTKGLFVTQASSVVPPNTPTVQGAQRDGVIFPSASRIVAVYTSDAYFAPDVTGLRLYINVTTNGGGTLVVKVQTFDQASQTWADIPLGTTGSITTDVMGTLTIHTGQIETAGVDVSQPIGVLWRAIATVTAATMVFSVGGEYLV